MGVNYTFMRKSFQPDPVLRDGKSNAYPVNPLMPTVAIWVQL